MALGAQGLDLFEHADNRGERFVPEHTGLAHLALAAESLVELQWWASWLDAHEVARSETREVHDIGAMLVFVDPNGVQLEFIFIDLEKLQRNLTAHQREGRSSWPRVAANSRRHVQRPDWASNPPPGIPLLCRSEFAPQQCDAYAETPLISA